MKVIQQLHAILDETEVVVQMSRFDGRLDQQAVGGIVVGHQYGDRFSMLSHEGIL